MAVKEQKLADRLNVNAIQYVTKKRVYRQEAVVTYSKSQHLLRFNEKMIKLLQLESWESVLMGYDKRSKIIVMKKVDPEEYGAVSFRANKENDPAKVVGVAHLVNQFDLTMGKVFRAEKNGDIILMEATEVEK